MLHLVIGEKAWSFKDNIQFARLLDIALKPPPSAIAIVCDCGESVTTKLGDPMIASAARDRQFIIIHEGHTCNVAASTAKPVST